jgi:hypothetical protein
LNPLGHFGLTPDTTFTDLPLTQVIFVIFVLAGTFVIGTG